MMKDITYSFKIVPSCNMCGFDPSQFSIMGRRLNGSQGRNPKHLAGITTTIMKCKNCGLIFSNPMPVPLRLEDHYGVNPEDYWIPDYFVIDEPFRESVVRLARKFTGTDSGAKCLDMGAGIGRKMRVLLDAGFDAYGFEASESFYNCALNKLQIPENRIQKCTVETAQYPDNTFDFITFNAVLEHLYDPSESITRSLKWLKPGGIMEIEVPSSDWLVNKLINIYYSFTCKDFVGNISPMHTPFHLYEFTPRCFELNGKKNGYKIHSYYYFHGIIKMPKLLQTILNWVMNKTNTGMQLFIFIKKN